MSLDWRTRTPRLATVFGGLSGPAIKPVALRIVHEVWRELKVPIIGVGGIMDEEDVMEFLVAGAAAIQVGTATFSDPLTIPNIVEGLASLVGNTDEKKVDVLVGSLRYGS